VPNPKLPEAVPGGVRARGAERSHAAAVDRASHVHAAAADAFRKPALHSRSVLPESSTFYYPAPGASSRRHTCDYSQQSFRSVGSSFRDDDLYIDDLMYAASQSVVKKEMQSVPVVVPVAPVALDCQVTESRLRSLEAELSKMRVALAHSMSQQASTSAHPLKSSDEEVVKASLPSRRSSDGHGPVQVEEVGVAMGDCGSTGCLAHLQPVNRGGGLLAKTLHLLRFRGFGRSKGAVKHGREPVISAPIVESVERGSLRGFPARVQIPAPRFDDHRSRDNGRFVGRNDSMPRPLTSRPPKPSHHARHKSFS
jgi:hypothetical protein